MGNVRSFCPHVEGEAILSRRAVILSKREAILSKTCGQFGRLDIRLDIRKRY